MECFKVFKKNWINFRNKPPHSKWFKFRVFNHFTTISRNSRKKLLIPKNFLSYLRNNEWCIFLESETLRLVNALILMHFLQMKKSVKFLFSIISLCSQDFVLTIHPYVHILDYFQCMLFPYDPCKQKGCYQQYVDL